MFARRVSSALFIDYENVSHKSLPDTIKNWLAWLEEGEFDPAGKRRSFIEKRIYWNTMAEQHRDKFAACGFTAVLCEKFAGLKNGADIRMALDIHEVMLKQPRISEFILITRDSDFVPVLQRLAQHSKETAILVSEQRPHVHSTFSHYADIVIPVRKFMAATTYTKPTSTLFEWWRKRKTIKPVEREPPVPKDPMELATDHVLRVTSRKPNQFTSRVEIEKELKKVPGFSTRGRNAYLGKGTYRSLMQEVAKRSDRIVVSPAGHGGVGVRYVPKDEED